MELFDDRWYYEEPEEPTFWEDCGREWDGEDEEYRASIEPMWPGWEWNEGIQMYQFKGDDDGER